MICPRCKRSYGPGQLVCLEDGADLVDSLEDPHVQDGVCTVVEGAGKKQGRRGRDEVLQLKPGDRVGDYEITSELGKGGMAQVYAGVHPVIGKRVAIKVLLPSCSRDPEIAARFVQEARAVNRAATDRIVDIFALGELSDGRLYLVMDLVEGITLHELIKQRGPLPLALAIPILIETARAIEVAHAAGIVHRDLKPQNIMLRLTDDGSLESLKVLDFGVAKLTAADAPDAVSTQTGVSIGTPNFMPPEQLEGAQVGPRADIYALGVTAFQMLTRRLPFEGHTPAEQLCRQLSAPAPSIRQICGDLPQELEQIVARCLAREPSERPGSMAELIRALEAITPQQPAPQPRQAAPKRGRGPLLAGIGAALGLLVLGAVLVFQRSGPRREPAAAAAADARAAAPRAGSSPTGPTTLAVADAARARVSDVRAVPSRTGAPTVARAVAAGSGGQKGRGAEARGGTKPAPARAARPSGTSPERATRGTPPPARPEPPPPRAPPPPPPAAGDAPKCNYGKGGWLWRDGACSLRVTSSTPHHIQERLRWFEFGGFRTSGGRLPRCQRNKLGNIYGLFSGAPLAQLAGCHKRHARCAPRHWGTEWELEIQADGSVARVKLRKGPGPAGLQQCVEPLLRKVSWAACGQPVTVRVDFSAMRSRSKPACRR
jgi:serine/threonine-protein kinase